MFPESTTSPKEYRISNHHNRMDLRKNSTVCDTLPYAASDQTSCARTTPYNDTVTKSLSECIPDMREKSSIVTAIRNPTSPKTTQATISNEGKRQEPDSEQQASVHNPPRPLFSESIMNSQGMTEEPPQSPTTRWQPAVIIRNPTSPKTTQAKISNEGKGQEPDSEQQASVHNTARPLFSESIMNSQGMTEEPPQSPTTRWQPAVTTMKPKPSSGRIDPKSDWQQKQQPTDTIPRDKSSSAHPGSSPGRFREEEKEKRVTKQPLKGACSDLTDTNAAPRRYRHVARPDEDEGDDMSQLSADPGDAPGAVAVRGGHSRVRTKAILTTRSFRQTTLGLNATDDSQPAEERISDISRITASTPSNVPRSSSFSLVGNQQSPDSLMEENVIITKPSTNRGVHCTRRGGILAFGVLLIVLILATVISLVPLQRKEDHPTQAPLSVATISPSFYPTSLVRLQHFQDALSSITPYEVLSDPNTFQYQAVEWMAYRDPAQLDLTNTTFQDLEERYIISLLYFATNGPRGWRSTNHFLTRDSICQWNSGEDSLGIFCFGNATTATNASLGVTSIELRK